MSQTLDQRVVELQFDNAEFEKGIKTTLESLEKLNEKLELKDAGKGFEELQKAADSLTLSKIADSVDDLTQSFKGLYTIGGRVANMVKKFISKNLLKALTSVPRTFFSSIKGGLDEYTTQIDATQTIFINVKESGASMADVTAALDELNEYADQTIYNFTQMTQNIGRFVTAGAGLTESVKAVKGLSNLSALMGANSEQNSRAMYNMSQALSVGYMSYVDWKTMQNTGMGGEKVQEMFIKSAKAHNVNYDKLLKKKGSFAGTLSKKWLTSDILLDVMENLTLVTEDSTEAEIEYARQLLAAKGYKGDDIDYWIELAKSSSAAATKVTTFTKLIDTLNEAMGSGWTKTWQLIIGDYEEASEMWTSVSKELSKVVDASADARNQILSNWAAFGGRDLLLQAGSNLWTGLKNSFGQIVSTFYTSIMGSTDLEWGNIGQELKNATQSLRDWTDEVLAWANGTDVLTGVSRMEEFAAIGKGLADAFKLAGKIAEGVWNFFSKIFGLAFGTTFFDELLMAVSTLAEGISGIYNLVSGGTDIGQVFTYLFETISGGAEKVWNAISEWLFGKKGEEGEERQGGAVKAVTEWATNLWISIKEGVAKIVDSVKQQGYLLWKRLELWLFGSEQVGERDGIEGAADVVERWATRLWQVIKDSASKILAVAQKWGSDLWAKISEWLFGTDGSEDLGFNGSYQIRFDGLVKWAEHVAQTIQAEFPKVIAIAKRWGSALWSSFQEWLWGKDSEEGRTDGAVKMVKDWAIGVWAAVAEWLPKAVDTVKGWGAKLWKGIKDAIFGVEDELGNRSGGLDELIYNWLMNLKGKALNAKEAIKKLWPKVKKWFKDTLNGVKQKLLGVGEGQDLEGVSLWDAIKDWALGKDTNGDGLRDSGNIFTRASQWGKNLCSSLVTSLKKSKTGEAIASWWKKTVGKIKLDPEAFSNAFSKIGEWLRTAWANIKMFFVGEKDADGNILQEGILKRITTWIQGIDLSKVDISGIAQGALDLLKNIWELVKWILFGSTAKADELDTTAPESLRQTTQKGIIETIGDAIANINWSEVGAQVAQMANGIGSTIVDIASQFWNGLVSFFTVPEENGETSSFQKGLEQILGVFEKIKEKGIGGALIDSVKSVIDGVSEIVTYMFEKLPWDDIYGLMSNLGTAFLAFSGSSLLKNGGRMLGNLGNMLNTIGTNVNTLGTNVGNFLKELTGTANTFGTNVSKKVGDFFTNVGKSFDNFTENATKATNKQKTFDNIMKAFQEIGTIFLKIGGAVLMLAVAAYLLQNVNEDGIQRMFKILAAVVVAVAGLSYIIGTTKVQSLALTGLAATFIALGVAVLIMAGAVAIFAIMDPNMWEKGLERLAVITIGIVAAIHFMTQNLTLISSGMSMIGLALVILAFVAAVTLLIPPMLFLATLDDAVLFKGILALIALAGILVVAINFIGEGVTGNFSGKKLIAAGALAILLAVAITALLVPITIMGMMKLETLVQGGLATIILGGILTIMVGALCEAVTGNFSSKKLLVAAATGILLAVAITALLVPITIMGMMKLETLVQGGLATIILGGILTIMVGALCEAVTGNFSSKKLLVAAATAVILTVCVAALAALVVVLVTVQSAVGIEAMWSAAGAVVALCFVLSACVMGITRAVNGNFSSKKILVAAGLAVVLTVCIIALAAVVYALTQMGDTATVWNAIGQVAALGGLITVMTIVCSLAGKSKGLWKGVAAMAICTILLAAMVGIAYLASKIDGLDKAVIQIALLAGILTALMLVCALAGAIGTVVLKGAAIIAGALAIIAVGVAAVISIMSAGLAAAGNNLLKAGNTFKHVADAFNSVDEDGLQNGIDIVGMIGGIFEAFKKLDTSGYDTVAPKLNGMAAKLSIANVLLGGITTDGSKAKTLADNIAAMYDSLASVTELENYDTLAGTIAKIGAAMFLFADDVSEGEISDTAVKNSGRIGEMLSTIAAGMVENDVQNKIAELTWLADEGQGDDLTNLGLGLVTLAGGLANYSKTAAGIKIGKIILANLALDQLVSTVNKITPVSGENWFTNLIGYHEEDKISQFSTAIAELGGGLASYCLSLDGCDIEKAKNAVGVAEQLMNLQNKLLDSTKWTGGVWGWFTANTDITGFGQSIETMGTYLSGFAQTMNESDIDGNKVEAAVRIVERFGEVQERINKLTAGESSTGLRIGDLSWDLKQLPERIKEFYTNLQNAGLDNKDNVTAVNEQFAALMDGLSTTFYNFVSTVDSATKSIGSIYTDAYNSGVDIGQGLIDGLGESQKNVYNTGYRLGLTAIVGINAGAEVNSPSKKAFRSGMFIDQGLANGLAQYSGLVMDAGEQVSKDTLEQAQRLVDQFSSTVSANLNDQPVIRPVLDLTNLQNGNAAINGMLGGSYGINPGFVPTPSYLGSAGRGSSTSAESYSESSLGSAVQQLSEKVNQLGDKILGMQLVLDSGELVGGIAEQMDNELGARTARKVRGS